MIGAITAEFDQSLTIESGNLAFSEFSLQKSTHIRFGSEGRLADGSHGFDVKIDRFAEGPDKAPRLGRLAVGTRDPTPGIFPALERLADITPLASDLDVSGAGWKLGERGHFSCAIRVHLKLKLDREGSK
jgi:hypothetical protein